MHHLFHLVFGYAAFCILSVLLLIIIKAIYNIFLHPLRYYPGPKSWAATRLIWAHAMQSGRFHQRLHELHQQYDPIVRIAPNELSYIDAQAWKDVYQPRSGHSVIAKNGLWAKQPLGAPHSVMSIDEAAHTRNRRLLSGAFTEHAIVEHAPNLESYVRLMISKLKDLVASGQGSTIVDIVDWFNFLTFDISGALSFGESFDSVKNGNAHPWVEISCNFGKGLALMASVNLFSPMDKVLSYTIPKNVLEKTKYHRELVHQKLEQRLSLSNGNKSQDFVGSILQYNQTKGEIKVPMEELEANMSVLIFAGSETTGSAMVSVLSALLRNPEVLQGLVDKIRDAFASEDEIAIANVGKIEYLTAVIQKGIRLGPPAAVDIPRVVPKGGEVICGQWVPGGTFVSLNQYPAFHSPSNFTDPDAFIPERFTPSTPYPTDNTSVFEPFTVGRHKCLGQKLAWAEMRLTLAHLLYTFDISPTDEVHDFGEQNTYIFWEKRPLRVELRSRKYAGTA